LRSVARNEGSLEGSRSSVSFSSPLALNLVLGSARKKHHRLNRQPLVELREQVRYELPLGCGESNVGKLLILSDLKSHDRRLVTLGVRN
jgi:hypothetical protein